jgi:hypothetical protein
MLSFTTVTFPLLKYLLLCTTYNSFSIYIIFYIINAHEKFQYSPKGMPSLHYSNIPPDSYRDPIFHHSIIPCYIIRNSEYRHTYLMLTIN